MLKKLFILLFLFQLAAASEASTLDSPWARGLHRLQQAAINESVETFAVFVNSSGKKGRWFFPPPSSASEARLNLSGSQVISLYESYLNEVGASAEDSILVIAHTHPRSTILKQISADQEVFKNGRPLSNFVEEEGLITNPPSRDDLAAPYVLEQVLERKGLGQTQVFGVVVDPSGAYRHRLFSSLSEKVRMFPKFEGETPYQHLDGPLQIQYDERMDKKLYEARRNWIFFVNESLSTDESFDPSASHFFNELKLVYASYGIGAALDYAPELSLAQPEVAD